MAQVEKTQKLKPLVSTRLCALLIILAFAAGLFSLFAVSMLDTDKTVSERDNRMLKTRPKFSVSTVLDGSYARDFDAYYSDTFPLRDQFLTLNNKIKKLFSQTRSTGGDMVIVDFEGKDDFAGQDID